MSDMDDIRKLIPDGATVIIIPHATVSVGGGTRGGGARSSSSGGSDGKPRLSKEDMIKELDELSNKIGEDMGMDPDGMLWEWSKFTGDEGKERGLTFEYLPRASEKWIYKTLMNARASGQAQDAIGEAQTTAATPRDDAPEDVPDDMPF